MNRKFFVNGNKNAVVWRVGDALWANIEAARVMDFPLTELVIRALPNGQKLELTPILGENRRHIDHVALVEGYFGVSLGGRRRPEAKARLERIRARSSKGSSSPLRSLTGTATICKYIDSSGTKKTCHGRKLVDAMVVKHGSQWLTVSDGGVTVFVRTEAFQPSDKR